MPAVLWDQVILTCQGSATPGATTWYKDGKRWWQKGPDRFSVTSSGTYECERPGTGLSSPVLVLDDTLVLQVPARALLEGDTMTLRCRCSWHSPTTEIRFYRKKKDLWSFEGTELSLSPLQLHHSGCYHCRAKVVIGFSQWWKESAPVTVTVHATRKTQDRAPPDPPVPVEEGEVLYTHVMVTEQVAGPPWDSSSTTSPWDPQVTYAELLGPNRRLREPNENYETIT
ncbi:low affinity immunoglobulin gamma Fc region receptor II-like isoform X15 [Willisornis vidua]|nr:low affinity immunoglobulin gamma Fc region receptor II-like isoform X15 [Willisornis vidua]